MFPPEICARVVEKFPDSTVPAVPERYVRDPEPQVAVTAKNLFGVCRFLRDNEFDLPLQMTAVDYIKENVFELVYYLYASQKKQAVVVKCRIDRANPVIDSVAPIWAGMDWQEREVYDLMGITFRGHPNLKRIMMWDGFPGHPLRKDYVHVTDRFDSGLEVGTPGLDEKGVPLPGEEKSHGH